MNDSGRAADPLTDPTTCTTATCTCPAITADDVLDAVDALDGPCFLIFTERPVSA